MGYAYGCSSELGSRARGCAYAQIAVYTHDTCVVRLLRITSQVHANLFTGQIWLVP